MRYLKSTSAGKVWNLWTEKTRDGFVEAVAVEGEVRHYGNFTAFASALFAARTVRAKTGAKRATEKAKDAALAALRARLISEGLSNGEEV